MSMQKQGFMSLKAKTVMAIYILISIGSRISAIVLYFAPALGLFGLLNHYKFGQMNFVMMPQDPIFDVKIGRNISLSEAWQPMMEIEVCVGHVTRVI